MSRRVIICQKLGEFEQALEKLWVACGNRPITMQCIVDLRYGLNNLPNRRDLAA